MQSKPESTASLRDTRGDKELIATAKAGDELSFQTLFKRHRTRIFTLALRYTRIREDAEDIVQQTFEKAFVYLPRFEGKSAFSTWLTRIAINESLMFLRKVRARREVPFDEPRGDEHAERHLEKPDASPDPEAAYIRQESAQILTGALRQLKQGTRSALELLELRELSFAQTARQIGISVAATKARVFHGRRKLRKLFTLRMRAPRMARRTISGISGNVNVMSQGRLACNACD
jgi:RNA polymerase sigma-70 factor, ECF subfamily